MNISIDFGNKVAGYVIFDRHPFQIKDLGIVDTDIVDDLKEIISRNNIQRVVYENTFMYKNWTLLRMQKSIRLFCKERILVTKALLPSQKYGQNNKTKRSRKNISIQVADDYLKEKIEHPNLLSKFRGFKRRHDIADALLMAIYDSTH
jgi:hypothetical protein